MGLGFVKILPGIYKRDPAGGYLKRDLTAETVYSFCKSFLNRNLILLFAVNFETKKYFLLSILRQKNYS